MKKKIIVTIAKDGTLTAEGQGIKGKGCAKVLDNILKPFQGVGRTENLLPEYYQEPTATRIEERLG